MKQHTLLLYLIAVAVASFALAKDSTPLDSAIASNNIEEARRLLDSGIDPNGTGRGYCPLTLACTYGYIDIVSLLLERGADINSKSYMKPVLTPLIAAAQAGHKEVVIFLLDKGANPSLLDDSSRDARQIALKEAQRYGSIANLLSGKVEQDTAANP